MKFEIFSSARETAVTYIRRYMTSVIKTGSIPFYGYL